MELSRSDGFWIKEEINRADFGDLRLNKRFEFLAAELANKPSQPINQASTDWAAMKGAYRFFDNPKVTAQKIIEPHFLSTQLRAASYRRILVIQDTSVIDFTKHVKTTGLGSTGKTQNGFEPQGLILHCALALTERGLPLGLLDHQMWPRTRKAEKNGHLLSLMPVEKKESFKWFQGLRKVLKRSEEQEVIMVCDREGDIYEFLEENYTNGLDFVVRVSQNRMLNDDEFDDVGLFDRIGFEKSRGKIKIDVPGSGKRKARAAELDLKFLPVTYAGQPRGIRTRQVKNRHDLDLFVVHLKEENPPRGEDPISWTLITSLEVKSIKSALEIVHFYKLRWNIELYFKCLKTGCGVEQCRMNTGEKLMRFISLQSIIAWRILWMTFLNRSEPRLTCDNILTDDEWKTLWLKRHRRQIKAGEMKPKPPDRPPSTSEAVKWIAMLGGFPGRKGDGEPGLITLWRGWLELASAVELYEVMK